MSKKRENPTTGNPKKRGRKSKADETYDVERIDDCRWSNEKQRFEYYIKWSGYDEAAKSWEGADNLDGCQMMVENYHREIYSRNAVKYSTPARQRKPSFHAEDEIDADVLGHLGPTFPFDRYRMEKSGAGSYTITAKNDNGASTSASPGETERTDLDDTAMRNATDTQSGDAKKKLDEWINTVNEVCLHSREAKLKIENNVDDAVFSKSNFVYVTSSRYSNEIVVPEDGIVGCNCKNGSCKPDEDECCAAPMDCEFAYGADRKLCLPVGRPIYECNVKCNCGVKCLNRVVQKGRKVELCIFRTDNGRGWGVKALNKIKKGTFVTEYVGEIIHAKAADERKDGSYMFTLDFSDDDPLYVIDAKYFGNVSRFINHSCDPNLAVYGTWIEHLEPTLPRLSFFAQRDIKKNEEITFNYFAAWKKDAANNSARGEDSDEEELTTATATATPSRRGIKGAAAMVSCICGADKCLNYKFSKKE